MGTVLRSYMARTDLAREVWKLAWPVITHMLLLTTVVLVGRAMVGRYSTEALASMQISGAIVWTLYAVFSASATGTLAVVARCVGAGDRLGAASVVRVMLIFTLLIGIFVSVPMLLAQKYLLEMMFPELDVFVAKDAEAYLSIVLPFLPFGFLEAVAASVFQALGNTRTPLIAGALGNIINLVLSAVLIFGLFGAPELGVRGAAIGAASTMFVEATLLVTILLSKQSPLALWSLGHGQHFSNMVRVLRVAAPTFAERILYQGGHLAFVSILGMLGTTALAAHQGVISSEMICILLADGVGTAVGALVAQKLGAGLAEEAAEVGMMGSVMAVMALSCFSVIFMVVPSDIISLFSNDPATIHLGTQTLYVAAIAQPFMAFATVIGMGLRGAGATRAAFLAFLISSCPVRLGATWFFAITLGYGLPGIWMGSASDWIVLTVLLGSLWRWGRWKKALV